MAHALRLLLISGSLRSGSTNTAALRTARAVAPPEIETTLYDGIGRLPHFNPDDDREGAAVDPEVAALRAAIADADGLVLCTPEYAGALPGSFKNLLEWTVGDASTYRKPVAWINVSGVAAPTGGADAHDSLRKVLGYVGAHIVEPACVRIPLARSDIGDDGEIAGDAIRGQIRDALTVFADAVRDQDASAASA
jgi:NAD(P)H-dependent FMN reductase